MAAGDLSTSSRVRQTRVECAAVNVRLLVMLLMSFVVLTVQLPHSAQAAVLRIPTGTHVLNMVSEAELILFR